MTPLTALTVSELTDLLGSRSRALRARHWLLEARPLPAALPPRVAGIRGDAWAKLREQVTLPEFHLRDEQASADGTLKLSVDLGGSPVETVVIPGRGRSTVCVSTQSGCTRRCVFCATARMGFARNLSAGEIVLQYLLAQARAPAGAPARNVVFMGMGEPLDNLEAVMGAVRWLTDDGRPALAESRVTVSTSGVLPGLERFLSEGRGQIALSLNAVDDGLRARLMPHGRTWPIERLLRTLRDDQAAGSGRRYFIEYVLWDGVNDSAGDARRLVELLAGLNAHVNLIPMNAHPGSELRPSPAARVAEFHRVVAGAGVRCLVRRPRGSDIAAACGQLAGEPAPPVVG
jgi:23S rRNA (adenine2503-C2)-methyltransferase